MSDARLPHLVFSTGASWYAVPAERAAEVVSVPDLTRVPGAPAHLLGVFAHRGEVIPVVDLGLLTGAAAGATQRAVLLRLAQGCLALTASRVAGVSQLSDGLSALGQSGVHLHLRGPADAQGRQVAIIEPEGLFEFLSQGGAS
jgi:purine-binding chemotaxis protein CheW